MLKYLIGDIVLVKYKNNIREHLIIGIKNDSRYVVLSAFDDYPLYWRVTEDDTSTYSLYNIDKDFLGRRARFLKDEDIIAKIDTRMCDKCCCIFPNLEEQDSNYWSCWNCSI